MRKQIIFAIFSLATLSIHADEGMWMLTDLKAQNAVAMRELGLEIPVEEVYLSLIHIYLSIEFSYFSTIFF